MKFNILTDSVKRTPRKKILELMELIDKEEEPPDSTINIVFINDMRMARLNEEFRNKIGATDVLSFNIDDDAGDDSILGEIYISTETAQKNAAENGVSYTNEILRLCCHGFLHLLGYDHEKTDDRLIMEDKERVYLGR